MKKDTLVFQQFQRMALCLLLALVLLGGCADQEPGGVGPGGPAPSFSLRDLKGKTLHSKDLRGKVVLLNFFATWCAPCRQEVPDFARLYEQFKDQGFEIVAIGVDMEGESVLRPFADHFRIPYPVLVGTRDVVVDYGGITGVPTSFFIDRRGYVTERFIGLRPPESLEKTIVQLLGQKGP